MIVFHKLTKNDLKKVIELEIKEVRERLKERKMELLLSPESIDYLTDKGYDPVYGARPLRRAIQNNIENVLAEEILNGKFVEGDKILAEIHAGRIVFEKAS